MFLCSLRLCVLVFCVCAFVRVLECPVECFWCLFCACVCWIPYVVSETNRYAAQCLEGKSATWSTNERGQGIHGVLYLDGFSSRARDTGLLVQ